MWAVHSCAWTIWPMVGSSRNKKLLVTHASSNKCHASSNKCLTSRNKKPCEPSHSTGFRPSSTWRVTDIEPHVAMDPSPFTCAHLSAFRPISQTSNKLLVVRHLVTSSFLLAARSKVLTMAGVRSGLGDFRDRSVPWVLSKAVTFSHRAEHGGSLP